MSIENAVIEVLSSGNFDDMSPSLDDWSADQIKKLSDMVPVDRPEYIFYDDLYNLVSNTLTARQNEQMQHYKAEADRADI